MVSSHEKRIIDFVICTILLWKYLTSTTTSITSLLKFVKDERHTHFSGMTVCTPILPPSCSLGLARLCPSSILLFACYKNHGYCELWHCMMSKISFSSV